MVIVTFAMPSFAIAKKETVKVGFFPIDDFFEYNEVNKEVGYGVDLINRISVYSDLDFECVKLDRNDDIYEALDKGEIDVLMPVTDTRLISEKYKVSNNSVINTYNAIMTLKDRDDLYYSDKDTMTNIKIAIMQKHYDFDINKEKLFGLGVSQQNLNFNTTYGECVEKLESGKVDAVISNIMDLTDDLKLIEKFDEI